MQRKFILFAALFSLTVVLTACSRWSNQQADLENSGENNLEAKSIYSIGMVTDTGGVNDNSFNQSAWEGLQSIASETGARVSYLESIRSVDYSINLQKKVNDGTNLIWGIGYDMADALKNAANLNKNVLYGIIDNAYDKIPDNVTCVTFSGQESAFLVGYIAGLTTKTNAVGFVGGMENQVIEQFEYGYRAGVLYAAKDLGKTIDVQIKYIDSYTDTAKGKAAAKGLFSNGCDIVFHAAGGAGTGVIEAAVEAGRFVIGADSDQYSLAPDNVLTSALKRVDIAIADVSQRLMDGEHVGGKVFNYDLKNGGVGIPEENPNMDSEVYEKALEIQNRIAEGKLFVPYNANTFHQVN